MTNRFAIQSTQITTPEGILDGAIIVADGGIESVVDRREVEHGALTGLEVEDFNDCFVIPGVIDGHVHINQPGRTEWEGVLTATRAAAAGGITTVVDMPLNSSPVTIDRKSLLEKRTSIAEQCWVDVGQHGGAVRGEGNNSKTLARNIEELIDDGVMGIKVFLCDSGLEEFPPVGREELEVIMPILARRNVPLWVHAELVPDDWQMPFTIDRYRDWPQSRSKSMEKLAIEQMIELAGKHSCPTHIVHLANADALPVIRQAKHAGIPLTVETCPHYLHFCEEQIPDGDPRYKCCPPIRELQNREKLWEALELGIIDTIGSDHSPCPPELKHLDTHDFAKAWGGICSLQLMLPIIWYNAMRRRIPVTRLIECLSVAPAKLLGIDQRKGSLTAGMDADIVILDPNTAWKIEGEKLFHRHKPTPYEGEQIEGQVTRTYLRGTVITEESPKLGSILLRS